MKKRLRFVAFTMAIILAGCGSSQQEYTSGQQDGQESMEHLPSSTTPAPEHPQEPTALVPKYSVIDRDTYDAPIKTQIEIHAVVSGTITDPGLKQVLKNLYDQASATRGFKCHGGRPTHVFIYLYTSRDHFKSGMGQWIAMLSKVGEESPVDTEVRTELVAQLHSKPEVKYGLPESKRKEVFRAIVTAEDRADVESQQMHPPLNPLEQGYTQAKARAQFTKQTDAFDTLMKKYKSQIAKQYGITKKQLREISLEAHEKNWPMR